MGVIIDGQERKSVAEQVEENSKYKGKLKHKVATLYKKDIPCYLRIIIGNASADNPLRIRKGDSTVLTEFTTANKIVDYIIIPRYGKARLYTISGTTWTTTDLNYNTFNWFMHIELKSPGGNDTGNYIMIIPLEGYNL